MGDRSDSPLEPRSARFGGYVIRFTRAETMEQVFGSQPLTPGQMMKRLWDYIKRHGLATR